MPSSYSSNLRLELIASGEQANAWGNTTNTNLGTLLESSIAGRVELSSGWVANSLTLTALNGANDQSRQMCLVVPAITISANSNIVVPVSAVTATSGKLYTVINRSTSYTVTIKLPATTGVTIPANTTKTVIYNGTDFQEAFTALNFLTLTGTPTVNAHAVNKGYVDSTFFINAGANTVTGNTTFSGTVTLPVATPTGNQATSYNYVNTNYLWKASGVSTQIMNPFLRLNYTPTNPADAVHKAYVDGAISTITSDYLPLTGGTLTGALTLAGAPTTNLQPATKLYVDDIATAAANIFLPFTGGTLTGNLFLNGAPSSNLQAATKLYVDSNTTDKQPLDGDLTAIAGLTGGAGFLKKTGFETWGLDTNTYITGNQNITLSGAITGSGTTTITTTLADSPVVAGSYTNASVTVNAKGIVTSASNGSAFALPTATDTTLGGVRVNGTTVSISSGTLFLSSTNVVNALGYTACSTDGGNATGIWAIDTSGSADYLRYGGSFYTANQFYLASNPSGYVTGTGGGASGTWNIDILGSAALLGGYSAASFVLDTDLTTILANYPTNTGVGATGLWGISVTGSSTSCTGNSATASAPSGGGSFITSSNIGSQSVATAGTCTGNSATASAPSGGGSFITSSNIGSQSVFYAQDSNSAVRIDSNTTYTFTSPTYNNATASTAGAIFRTQVGGGAAPITAVNSNNTGINGAAIFLVRTNSSNSGPPTGEGAYVSFLYGTGAISGAGIISQGGGTQIAYATGSDYRLKQNVTPLTGAMNRVAALNPVTFEFIANPGVAVDGFLAHEVAEVVPNAINGQKDAVDEDGDPIYQGIDQAKIVPLLVAAIQELKAEIDALKGA
jgi:Chaperone of endosialidase